MADQFQFDRAKLKEAILLIAASCPPDELGNVKLHKTLYFSDMLHYLREGRPLTGDDYLKQKFGPVARHLTASLKALQLEGKLEVREEDYFGLHKKSYVPTRPYSPSILNSDERALVLEVLDFVRGKSAKEISEFSHSAPWEVVEIGEVIPYHAALRLVPDEMEEEDREWAIAAAREHAAEPYPY